MYRPATDRTCTGAQCHAHPMVYTADQLVPLQPRDVTASPAKQAGLVICGRLLPRAAATDASLYVPTTTLPYLQHF